MTAALLDNDTEVLIDLLARLSPPQLAIAVTQNPGLSEHIVNALRQLAAASISKPPLERNEDVRLYGAAVAGLVRKLVARGDPSLVRKLLPNQASLVDLALCTDASSLLARLLDETTSVSCIRASVLAFERALKDASGDVEARVGRIAKAARILSSLVSAMPSRTLGEEKLTKGQRERGSEESAMLCRAVASVRMAYQELGASDGSLLLLQTKVSLLDAAWFLAERHLVFVASSTKQSSAKEGTELLEALCGNALQEGSTPLVDMPLVIDLALVRPLWSLLSPETRKSSAALAQAIEKGTSKFTAEPGEVQSIDKLGSGWGQVLASVPSQRGEAQVPASLVGDVLAVLPHLEGNRRWLEGQLMTPRYAGKNAESVIQMLLEDEDEGADEELEGMDSEIRSDVEAIRLLQERANVFDDEQLQGAKVTRGKAKEREAARVDLSIGLSDDVRAAILARAEEPDADEDEEWNPFSDAALEVGFEEEIEEPVIEASKSARRAGLEDEEEPDDDEGDDVIDADGKGQLSQGAAPSAEHSTSVASERSAERMLIITWRESGESFFAKDNRRSAGRLALKTKLNDLPGRRWDDGLIESWATMFARNVSSRAAENSEGGSLTLAAGLYDSHARTSCSPRWTTLCAWATQTSSIRTARLPTLGPIEAGAAVS